MFRPDRGEPARAAPAPVFGWRMIALVAVVTVVAFYLLVLRGAGEVVQDGMVKDALAATATDAGASSSVARMVDSPRGDIWEDLRPDTQQLVRARLGDSPALLVEESLPGKGVMTRLPDRYRPVTVGQLQGCF